MTVNLKNILTLGILFTSLYIHATEPLKKSIWEVKFTDKGKDGKPALPKGWQVRTKIAVTPTLFSIKEEKGKNYLSVKSNDSSGTLICKMEKVDLTKTPILTWKWRAYELPKNGDGRESATDDQACGIYIGTGNIFSKKSISYRWDTDTPKGEKGEVSYAMGSIKVKWFTLENKDSKLKEWITEERNVAEDFKKAWGFIPKEVYLSICGNTQYTKTKGHVDIEWIKLKSKSVPQKETAKKVSKKSKAGI